MLQSFKKISLVLLLAFGLQTSWAFSLLGPGIGGGTAGDAWEVPTIGYGLPFDIGTPKNLNEEYRRNTPVIYYACNANFLNFFGSSGSTAVDQAFIIMNNSLTNVDAYSSGLTEFPLNSQAVNYNASGLNLTDLKSTTLSLLMEQMGLAEPDRYVWTLHNRYLPSGATCPAYVYQVVQRNFDITTTPLNQVLYSPYVNGTLYTYFIEEFCPASVPDPQALAVPVKSDPSATTYTAVADLAANIFSSGVYYISLTRDDVAGLRYLLTTNNINFESPNPQSVLLSSTVAGGTNYGSPFLLYTSDLTTFALAARTNDPTTLSNLYPGLIITSSAIHFSPQYVTNGYVAYYTNLIGAPIGSQTLVVAPVVTYSILTTYTYTFGNVVTNSYQANATATQLKTTVAPLIGGTIGSPLQTNTTATLVSLTGIPSGDFYINTNTCGPNLVLTNFPFPAVPTTNLIYAASNSAGLFTSLSQVTYSNQTALVVMPQVCGNASAGGGTTNSPGLYQGVGKVQFVKTSFDSLIGQTFQPITNTYTMMLVSNSKLVKQTFQRVVTAPDIVLSAEDLAPGPSSALAGYAFFRTINYNQGNINPGLAGPGTIDPTSTIIFNKVGTYYGNVAGGYELDESQLLAWASFDGSTNAPILYPDGASLTNLANQILISVTPATLPNGTNHVAYPATTFVVSGGGAFSPPFTWSLSSGSSLPAGLTLSSGGTISGTPTQSGTFDFTLQLTDSLSRTVQWSYPLIIQ